MKKEGLIKVYEIGTIYRLVQIFGKLIKYKWYHKLMFLKPIELGPIVFNTDTCLFNTGDKLYLDPNNPGTLTNKEN